MTSRVPLRLYGEQEFRVPTLAVTGDRREEAPGEAVQLFDERARGARPDLALQSDTLPVVTAICAHLDGLPLAIELAAARSKLLALGETFDTATASGRRLSPDEAIELALAAEAEIAT